MTPGSEVRKVGAASVRDGAATTAFKLAGLSGPVQLCWTGVTV
jgi:hypothetical protein